MSEIRTIENDSLLVCVADLGAELCRIYDKKQEREVLWDGNPEFWARRSPVLFPNVGKFFQNSYLHQGVRYEAAGHGFCKETEFTCIQAGPNQIIHEIRDTEKTRTNYPFQFIFRVIHTLTENQLTVTFQVENTGDNEMLFTVGGHPGFMVPAKNKPGTKQTDYFLEFAGKDTLVRKIVDLDSCTVKTDVDQKIQLEDHKIQITDHMFDQDALVFDDGQVETVSITYPDGRPYVSMKLHDKTSFGIWSNPGAPFVCLEPWFGRCDDVGFTGELSTKPGINRLLPTEKFEKGYEIIIHE